MSDVRADAVHGRLMPWQSSPGTEGFSDCSWCGRTVYAPAIPCSVSPIEGIEDMATGPGAGDRCKWEARVRGSLFRS